MYFLSENRQSPGWWTPGEIPPEPGLAALKAAIYDVNRAKMVIRLGDGIGVGEEGELLFRKNPPKEKEYYPLMGFLPAVSPQDLGDPRFKKALGLKYPYVVGAMANGITSVEMVEAAGRDGMIAFFGAAGLTHEGIESAINRLQQSLGEIPFGFNLIHSPNDPDLESGTVDLYLRRKIRLISASAYLGLTLPLVYYRVSGIQRDENGNIACPNKVIAKVSRIEVAEKFFSPPPENILKALIDQGKITESEANLARQVPMAEALTAEADSGGHTDNRPAMTLLPTIMALRDRIVAKYGYEQNICIGLGGGIATPESTAAAFAMGAAYVVAGTVHQACVESGTSHAVRAMLAQARQADITMAPSADMFEMGVKVQVLKRGTMFPLRAGKLYDLYNRHDCWESISANTRALLEKDFFKAGFEETWNSTREFFRKRDPRQIIRAEKDPKHKMALVFRSYLGQSSRWAVTGDPLRQIDYQIWCGPAMGAFNEWVKGSFLEKPENRKTVTIAMNLLLGACIVTRVNWLKNQGIILPPETVRFAPMPLSSIREKIGV